MATTPTQTQTKSKKPAKTERHYTVSYVPNRGDTSTPALNLSGKWLREVGVDTRTSVTLKIAGGLYCVDFGSCGKSQNGG